MQPLMSRLVVLELRDCHWKTESVASEMLSFCTKLHSLTIDSGRAAMTNDSIQNGLRQIPHLKSIEITECVKVNSDIIRSIVKYNPLMEIFRFWSNGPEDALDFIENAKRLKHLKALKSIRLNGYSRSVSPVLSELVAAHIPLESLEVYRSILDEQSIMAITKMKTIKTLYFSSSNQMEFSIYKGLIEKLSELTHLRLSYLSYLLNDAVELVRLAPKIRELGYFLSLASSIWKKYQICTQRSCSWLMHANRRTV